MTEMGMLEVRQLFPDDWLSWKQLRLQALADAPYAFGSSLHEWRDADEDRWRQRLIQVPYNAIAYCNGIPSGLIGCLVTPTESEVISVWVAPAARGHGVGDALLDAAITWCRREGPAGRIILHVREDNEPAARLYRRNGFVDNGLVDEGRVEAADTTTARERRMVLASLTGRSR